MRIMVKNFWLQGQPDHGAYSAAQPFLQNLPAIIISLPGQQRTLSTQQATELSLHQFAALYTVSTKPRK